MVFQQHKLKRSYCYSSRQQTHFSKNSPIKLRIYKGMVGNIQAWQIIYRHGRQCSAGWLFFLYYCYSCHYIIVTLEDAILIIHKIRNQDNQIQKNSSSCCYSYLENASSSIGTDGEVLQVVDSSLSPEGGSRGEVRHWVGHLL